MLGFTPRLIFKISGPCRPAQARLPAEISRAAGRDKAHTLGNHAVDRPDPRRTPPCSFQIQIRNWWGGGVRPSQIAQRNLAGNHPAFRPFTFRSPAGTVAHKNQLAPSTMLSLPSKPSPNPSLKTSRIPRPPPTHVDDDVAQLSKQIVQTHRSDVARLACLEFTTARLGSDQNAWPSGLRETLLALQQECRQSWMALKGITDAELQAAVASIARAEATIRYIDSLPA